MCQKIVTALLLVTLGLLTGCSGSASKSPLANSGSPVSLTIGDAPPNGVAAVFFEALITGASMQPSDMTKAAVSLTSTPVEIEFRHLQTDTAFLSIENVPPDTYKSITLTFGAAVLTIVNHSGAAIGSCANNSVCQVTPNFNPSTATISNSPFPLMIDANAAFGLQLDFDLNTSLQNDLSINPTVTLTRVTREEGADEDKEMEEVDDIDGQVTAVGTNQFTLHNEQTGQSFTIVVDSNTKFANFDEAGCTANPQDFSCVKMGQILEVDLSAAGTGTMLAKKVELAEDVNQAELKGTITTVDSSTQFHMVVFNEEPAVSGVSEGGPVVVTILPSASFQVDNDELDTSGFTFASSADLLVGQDIQVHPVSVTSAGGITTITTDQVRLRPSQITAQVGTTNPGNGTFTLTGLSPLFTGATPAITSITVNTSPETKFINVSGVGGLAGGNTVSTKGLLFNTAGSPTLVAKKVIKR